MLVIASQGLQLSSGTGEVPKSALVAEQEMRHSTAVERLYGNPLCLFYPSVGSLSPHPSLQIVLAQCLVVHGLTFNSSSFSPIL